MAALVKGLRRKTAQVKALAGGGYGAAETARFLGLGEAYVAKVMGAIPTPALIPAPAAPVTAERPVAGVIDAAGRLTLPPALAAGLGLTPGTPVVLRREGEALIVTARAAAEAEVGAFAAARLP